MGQIGELGVIRQQFCVGQVVEMANLATVDGHLVTT